MTSISRMPPLAQCPCPTGNLLPLIVVGVALWGLWRAAQWAGDWFANRRGSHASPGSNTARMVTVLVALAGVGLLAWGGVKALRPTPAVALAATDRPRMIFLGAGQCKPCQAMEPVRETLRDQYDDDLIVEYHDVMLDPGAGHRFGIRAIPTTLFVGPDGGELRRRQGFLSEEDIVTQWSELGFAITRGSAHAEE